MPALTEAGIFFDLTFYREINSTNTVHLPVNKSPLGRDRV